MSKTICLNKKEYFPQKYSFLYYGLSSSILCKKLDIFLYIKKVTVDTTKAIKALNGMTA